MEKINNFNCFRNSKKEAGSKQPDYYISTKIGEEFVTIGSGWVKAATDGSKFISFKLSDPYQDKPGFHITVDETIEAAEEEIL